MGHLDIDARTWATLNRLLDEALDLPPAQRDHWLDTLAPDHAGLRPRLRDLLSRATGGEQDPLATLPKFGEAADQASPLSEKSGDSVGPYRLLHLIAEGGMGSVWLAERSDGMINRPVALKLPRGSWQRATLAARLVRERNILAALNHPNIARLYDAGLTDAGLPFLALEYVDGRPIDTYCRDEALDAVARLKLVMQVARAVAHAHAHLVVHRDLKPSNILVTTDGQVRLLDFGIAQLLDDGTAVEGGITRTSGRALTLHYASPEQVTGEPIGVASDIYSLGVVLFELLVGEHPISVATGSRRAHEHAILHAEPRRPSDVVSDPRARRLLRGDIDTIVLKALKKAPGERYATCNALEEDIARHLAGQPVLARPDSTAYRLGKFIGRNRLAVASATAVLVAILAGSGLALWQARVALAEKERAAEVKDFITSVFRDADPYSADGRSPDAASLLVRAREKINRTFSDRPVLKVEMLNIVGWSLYNMQRIDEAESACIDALETAGASLAPDDLQFLRARLLQLLVDRLLGRTDTIIDRLDTLLPQLTGRNDVSTEEVLVAMRLYAHVALDTGDFAKAEESARAAYDFALSGLAPGHSEMASSAMVYALALIYAKKPGEAIPVAEEGVRVAEGLDPTNPHHPQAIETRMTLGRALQHCGELPQAEAAMKRSVQDAIAVLGESSMIAGFFSQNLATCQLELGRIDEAVENAERSAAIFENIGEKDSFTFAAVIGTRGRARLAARHYERALPDLEFSRDFFARTGDPAHERAVLSRLMLATALAGTGRMEDAWAALGEGEKTGSSASTSPRTLHLVGRMHRLDGNPDAGLQLQRAALELPADGRRERWSRLGPLIEAGLCSLDLGDHDAAALFFHSALDLSDELGAAPSPDLADAIHGIGRVRLAAGHADSAVPHFEAADRFWRDFDPESSSAAEVAKALGQAREAAGSL